MRGNAAQDAPASLGLTNDFSIRQTNTHNDAQRLQRHYHAQRGNDKNKHSVSDSKFHYQQIKTTLKTSFPRYAWER
jgi:putative salt-induced outer membrane protein YdiY